MPPHAVPPKCEVSVVVPAYNAEHTLSETLASVLDQTVRDIEVLVVDDGSSDGTWALARTWQARYPGKVRALQHEQGTNRGVAASRNLAIDKASGRFVAFLDADDAWMPHKLELQLAAFAKQPAHVGVVFCDAWNVRRQLNQGWADGERWLHPRSGELARRFNGEPGSSIEHLLFEPAGEFHNWVMSPTPLVRKECFADGLRFVGPPRLNTQFEDYLMWLCLALRCEFVALPEPLAYYRVHETQFVSRYVRQARCLNYLTATRELLDVLQNDCAAEVSRRGLRHRIDARFAAVGAALVSSFTPSGNSTIRAVAPGDAIPLLLLANRHAMLSPMLGALLRRVAGASSHYLRSNRVVHKVRRLMGA